MTPLAQIGHLINDALYRSRALVIIAVGTMPIMIFVSFNVSTRISGIFMHVLGCSESSESYLRCVVFPPNSELVNSLLALTALTVGFWGLMLLGASLGVGLALKSWYTTLLTVTAIVMLLIGSIWFAGLFLHVSPGVHYKSSCIKAESVFALSPNAVALCLLIMLVPYGLTVGMIFLSRRWVLSRRTQSSG